MMRGMSGEQLLQTSQMLYADGDAEAQAAPLADEQATQAEVAQPAEAQATEQQAQVETQPQAEQ